MHRTITNRPKVEVGKTDILHAFLAGEARCIGVRTPQFTPQEIGETRQTHHHGSCDSFFDLGPLTNGYGAIIYPRMPIKLADCETHGPSSGAELFLVEGDSAAQAVVNARDARSQAVLPMQGKPLNAMKASRSVVARNEWLQALIDAIGAGWGESFDLQKVRYERVLLMMDPDADGIHCGVLMLMFFHRWMRPLLESGRISVIRPPVYEISSPDFPDRVHAFSDAHYKKLCESLEEKQIQFNGQRYRGLASINASVLVLTCIDPATRHVSPLGCDDAESAIRIFGSQKER